ncbi:hypothetical protein PybrP1_009970 [[Pythium] brassicae (nom. inval.)]|nr:hypothetical protein PybrP1_009970 [[Pythium] brassicae (nom. inval.)]
MGKKVTSTSGTSAAGAKKKKKATSAEDARRTPTSATATALPALLRLTPHAERPLRAVDLHAALIFKVPHFFSRAECARVQRFADSEGFSRVTQRATREFAFRDNDRLLLRLEAFAALLWPRLAPLVPHACEEGLRAVGLNPNIRFYRYRAGQRFGCHVDQSDVDPVTGFHSRFTVLVYLNDASDSDLAGGSTVFYGPPAGAKKTKTTTQEEPVLSVAPESGAALVHGHGDRCLLHEGALVTRGCKYLLRTDVMYARV